MAQLVNKQALLLAEMSTGAAGVCWLFMRPVPLPFCSLNSQRSVISQRPPCYYVIRPLRRRGPQQCLSQASLRSSLSPVSRRPPPAMVSQPGFVIVILSFPPESWFYFCGKKKYFPVFPELFLLLRPPTPPFQIPPERESFLLLAFGV